MSYQKDKKWENKDPSSTKTWQAAHEMAMSAETKLQEFRDDARLAPRCEEIVMTCRDCVVQIMEAFYKRANPDKLRRFEAGQFYAHKVAYTLRLGQDAGWWDVPELITQADDLADKLRACVYAVRRKILEGENGDPSANST